MSEIKPVRLQLSRAKGFNLQRLSEMMNGLPAVKVDRTTKWGNPFIVGETFYGCIKIKNARHSWQMFLGFAPQNKELVKMARTELRGKNLACWCSHPDPYEDACHAAVLLKIANSDGDPMEAVLAK